MPAATGTAETKRDRNGNLKVKVEVKHLAQPAALTPPKQAYVVWTQIRGQDPQNQGQLKVNDNLEGSFSTTVPSPTFEIFITAEDNPTAAAPTGPRLLKGSMQP